MYIKSLQSDSCTNNCIERKGQSATYGSNSISEEEEQ